jgi:hypothetical protein
MSELDRSTSELEATLILASSTRVEDTLPKKCQFEAVLSTP